MRKSCLSKAKRLRSLEHLVAGTAARAAAELVGVNRFYPALRQIIAEEVEKAAPLHGEVEVDESCFGGKRKGKRGRGAAGKVPVFGLLKRGGRVYTLPIPNAKARTLMPILESRVVPDSIVYTGSFASYDVIDVTTFHHRLIDHAKSVYQRKGKRTSHWRYRDPLEPGEAPPEEAGGIPRKRFYCFLKEWEWRFNSGNHKELHRQLLGSARRERLVKQASPSTTGTSMFRGPERGS